MIVENLQQFDLDFYFEDDTDSGEREAVVKSVLHDRYADVDLETLAIDEMGGTTYLAYFDASGKRLPPSVLDLTEEEAQGRVNALFHLMSSDY